MPGIITDGDIYEAPASAALEQYQKTPPTLGESIAASAGAASLTGPLSRALERAQAPDASAFDRAQLQMQIPEGGGYTGVIPTPAPEPLLSAEEVNSTYGPIGPDGKQVKITDKPMSATLARIIGRQKEEELERNAVLARGSASASWPTNFAVGAIGFMMDPLNDATMFIPGVGEEATAARLGGGALARFGGRVVSGATAGAFSQAPLEALKVGLGTEEASDYGMRDAFVNLFYASAFNALVHTGLGTASEWWHGAPPPKTRPSLPTETPITLPASVAQDAAMIARMDAAAKYEAMRAGVAELATGRPMDVLPVLDMAKLKLLSEEAQLRQRGAQVDEFLQGLEVTPGAQAAGEQLARVRAIEGQLGAEGLTAEERRALSQRRDELLANTTPEELHEAAIPLELQRQALAQKAAIATRLGQIEQLRAAGEAEAALSTLPKVANGQSQLYKAGFAPGLTERELADGTRAIYGPKEAPPAKSGTQVAPGGQPAAQAATPVGRPARDTTTDQVAAAVEKQLVNAGRPAQEAKTMGALRAAMYEARAQARGQGETAADLFAREGAEIHGPGAEEGAAAESTPGARTLAQGPTPRERALTSVDLLSDKTPAARSNSRTVEDIAKGLMDRARTALQRLGVKGGKIAGPDPKTDELVSRAIATEIKAALERDQEHAGDWYTAKVDEAMRTAATMYPELATDPHARMGFTAALAVTSQGERVPSNVRLADQVYSKFRETGRFPTDVVSKTSIQMNSNFRKLNALLDEFGADGTAHFLHSEFTVKQLTDAGYTITGENMGTKVYGSAILGPKIGQGFFQNLNGNYTPVTMDLWFMRAWGRLTGTLTDTTSAAGLLKQRERLEDALRARRRDVPRTAPQLENVANEIVSKHEADFRSNREAYDSGEKVKSELVYAAERYLHGRNGIKEGPSSGAERNWIRDRVNAAREQLKADGIDITNADLQALWWYPEKELYDKLGGRDSEGLNVDYASAIRELAQRKGVSDEALSEAVRAAPRRPGPAGAPDVRGAVEGGRAQGEGPAANELGATAGGGGRPERPGQELTLHQGAAPATPEFKRWFGGSQVINPDGTPRVMFHTTRSPGFEAFRRSSNDIGMHFGTPEQAADRFDFLSGRRRDRRAPFATMPVYLKIDNPLRLPDVGIWAGSNLIRALEDSGKFSMDEITGALALPERRATGESIPEALRSLIKSKGYDGIVYKNEGEFAGGKELRATAEEAHERFMNAVKSDPQWHETLKLEPAAAEAQAASIRADEALEAAKQNGADSYIAFDQNQIKSVHNRGTFSARSGKILEQEGERASITLGAEHAIMRLAKTADASSFIHETGHEVLDTMLRDAEEATAHPQLKADAQTILEWLGAKDRASITTEQHETFARAFERYLHEGNAPTPALAGVFAKIKEWMGQIYRSLVDHNVEINDDIRGVMDRLFPEEKTGSEPNGARTGEPGAAAAAPRDTEMAEAEAGLDHASLTEDERAELAQTQADIGAADNYARAYEQAAACLAASGG